MWQNVMPVKSFCTLSDNVTLVVTFVLPNHTSCHICHICQMLRHMMTHFVTCDHLHCTGIQEGCSRTQPRPPCVWREVHSRPNVLHCIWAGGPSPPVGLHKYLSSPEGVTWQLNTLSGPPRCSTLYFPAVPPKMFDVMFSSFVCTHVVYSVTCL